MYILTIYKDTKHWREERIYTTISFNYRSNAMKCMNTLTKEGYLIEYSYDDTEYIIGG